MSHKSLIAELENVGSRNPIQALPGHTSVILLRIMMDQDANAIAVHMRDNTPILIRDRDLAGDEPLPASDGQRDCFHQGHEARIHNEAHCFLFRGETFDRCIRLYRTSQLQRNLVVAGHGNRSGTARVSSYTCCAFSLSSSARRGFAMRAK